jgi:ribonuclease HI
MRFKDQLVWVRTDAGGGLVLDGSGRAEMKYRETDEKSYRPAGGNLLPVEGETAGPRDLAAPARRNARAPAKTPALPDRMPGAIEVWTDGACSGNPGPMGIGVVVLSGDERKEVGEYLGIGTNNIAELTAIERGLEIAAEISKRPSAAQEAGARMRRVRVYSDSGYAIGLLEKGWKAKANQELVARLRQRVAAIPNLEFVKVRGHAGVPENERCDELARVAVQRAMAAR